MIHLRRHCWLLLLCSLAVGQISAATWDEVQLELLRQYPPDWRWDNLQSAPDWAGGVPPQYHRKLGYHTFRLQPGQETFLLLPRTSLLRLVSTSDTLTPDELEVWISNGSGLFVQAIPVSTSIPREWIIPLPEPSWIRITRPARFSTEVEFGAFCSRQEPRSLLAPHRQTQALPHKPVAIRRDDQLLGLEFWRLPAREPISLCVNGLTQVKIRVRVPWAEQQGNEAQFFQITVIMDNRSTNHLQCLAEAETRHRLWLDHRPARLARETEVYLQIPAGRHQLSLETSLPFWFRLETQDLPDYLFPRLNEPATNAARILSQLAGPADQLGFIQWENQAQAAWRLARDNDPRDAASQAADWLNRMALLRPDYPQARTNAAALWNSGTFYRELLPRLKSASTPVAHGRHATHQLRDPSVPRKPFLIADPVMECAEELSLSSQFVEVPFDPDRPLLYSLPPRSFESDLLVSAFSDSLSSAHFVIQFDALPPRRLSWSPSPELPPEALDPPFAVAAMAARASLGADSNSTGLGRFYPALPWIPTKDLRIPLPQNVLNIRIWRTDPPSRPLAVSVRYRAAKPSLDDEAAYRDLWQTAQARQPQSLQLIEYWRAFAKTRSAPAQPSDPLFNQWIPLLRLFETSQQDFAKTLADARFPMTAEAEHPLTASACHDLANQARQLEQNGDWIESLERWNSLFWQGPSDFRDESIRGIIRGLRELQEHFLMEQYLRWLALHGSSQSSRDFAWRELDILYATRKDLISVETARIGAALQCPCPFHLENLVDALEANQRHDMALWVGLSLPRTPRLTEILLHSTIHLRWWITFDELAESLSSQSSRAWWQARKALAQSRPARAVALLKEAGSLGDDLRHYLSEAERLAQDLTSPQPQIRAPAVLAWERWHACAPGPAWWVSAPELIRDFAGASLVYNPERDTYAQFYRATRSHPLVLRFLGPVRLRIDVRPILSDGERTPVDDDLLLREGALTNRFPLCQIGPSQSLQIIGPDAQKPGTLSSRELDFGPGLHLIQLALDRHEGLFQVLAERPEFPVTVLPAFTPRVREYALAGTPMPGLDPAKIPVERFGPLWQVSADAVDRYAASNLVCLTETWPTDLEETPDPPPASPAASENPSILPPLLMVDEAMSPEAILRRLELLLDVAEHNPPRRIPAQIAAEYLFLKSGSPAEAHDLMARLTPDRDWQLLPATPVAAGLRPIETPMDQPASPSQRVRRALLPPAHPLEQTLASQQAFYLVFKNLSSTRLHLRLRSERCAWLPPQSIHVKIQLDEKPPHAVTLDANSPETGHELSMSEGAHRVGVWIQDPVVDQFLRLSWTESPSNESTLTTKSNTTISTTEKVLYQIATPTQPVSFGFQGPGLLRVDEWREGRTRSQYILATNGYQIISLASSQLQAETLYRIYQRITRTNIVTVRNDPLQRPLQPVSPPRLALPPVSIPARYGITDYYPLGGQEKGTWSVGLRATRRRPLETSGQETANEFLQAESFYRYRFPDDRLVSRTQLLGRWHRPGGLSLGLEETLFGDTPWPGLNWAWNGSAFLGQLTQNSLASNSDNWESALTTSLTLYQDRALTLKTKHQPMIRLWGRYLTLDEAAAKNYTYVDHDLYTLYRDQHRAGLMLGDRLIYQPWLDTELQAGVYLTSNEDFNLYQPDNWSAKAAWQQYLGAFFVEGAYAFNHFLKDGDRSADFYRHGPGLTVAWDHWFQGRHRWEAGVDVRYYWPDQEATCSLYWIWHFGNGRGYRDFSASEVPFRTLRQRDLPTGFNNRCSPEPASNPLP